MSLKKKLDENQKLHNSYEFFSSEGSKQNVKNDLKQSHII